MRRAYLLLTGALWLLLSHPATAAKKPDTNGLVHVVTPEARGEARAHPHVNVIVGFGATEDGLPADLATFRARLGGDDISDEFADMVLNGQLIGKRAQIDKGRLKVGRKRTNRMRFSVSAIDPGTRGRPPRDVDRIRFRVVEAPNSPPVPQITEGPRSFRPGTPFTVDGSTSFDPDGDPITMAWDFGDGVLVPGTTVTHTYPEFADHVVRLVVRDGVMGSGGVPVESVKSETFLAEPVLPEGVLPGAVFLSADSGLEFGVVAIGASGARTLRIRNTDDRENHRVIARVTSDQPAFTIQPGIVDLGPGEEQPVTVTFAPAVAAHHQATLTLSAAAANRSALRVVAHGYGGAAGGTGPSLGATPVFYSEVMPNVFGFALRAILPDGNRIFVDNAVHSCQTASGFSSGDVCLIDADCAANGGTCQATGVCFGGDRNQQPCASVGDCPGGACSAATLFDAVDLCSDGVGGVYMLSEEGTFTDPAPSDNELAATVLRIDIDPQGTTTGKLVLDRVVTDTTKLGCDGIRPEADGRVYLAEFRTDPSAPISCIRSDRELLVGVNKRTGGTRTLIPRIDAAEGLNDCSDDFDPVTDLEVGASGQTVVAAFESGGIWRLLPSPMQFVFPETYTGGNVPSVFPHDTFRLHPDGSIVVLATGGGRVGGLLNVYRVAEAQVAGNPLPISALTPCQSIQLPTNAGENKSGFVGVLSFALGTATPGSRDGTALVAVGTGSQNLGEVLSPNLQVRATLAFSLPADQPTCSFAGIVALEAFDQLTF